MAKYIIAFSKTGTICFTSHLDLMRIFKRAFKRTGIPLAYSQGFNPHPKMGFAQPLSLGYWSAEEYIEFETADGAALTEGSGSGRALLPTELMVRLAEGLPEGIELLDCLCADRLKKTLASHTVAAEYMIEIPWSGAGGERLPADGISGVDLADPRALWHAYMDRPEITAWKRQKKKKEPKQIDIKPMIRQITFTPSAQALYIDAILDSGSDSNLSPELIIASLQECFGLDADRSEISVMRKKILFDRPLEKLV